MRAGYRTLQRVRAPERRRRNRRILAALLLVALLGAAAPHFAGPAARALGRVPLFQVRRIEVAGCVDLAPQDVRASLPVSIGDNLLLLDPPRLVGAVCRNARVDEAWISRTPGTLRVRVRERRTFVLLSKGRL